MRLALSFCFLFAVGSLFAQNETDALRASSAQINGSTRFMGMGSSMGALGGDHSLAGVNPAGISILKGSQISFSPYLKQSSVVATHYGNQTSESYSGLRVGNLGLNIRLSENEGDWKNIYLTYNFQNKSDYTSGMRLEGVNNESSQLDAFFNEVLFTQGTDLRGIDSLYPFGASLAWNTFLLDTFNNFFFTAIPNYGQKQIYTAYVDGRAGESNFSLSGLYKDKLYIGASVALVSSRYTLETNLLEEIPESDTSTFLNYFDYTQNLVISGEAFNAKLGIIYKWNDWVQTGLAVHTPDYYSFTDTWNSRIEAEYQSGFFEDESFDGLFNYRIQSPWKYIASFGFIYKKSFLFNLDYEYLNYRTAQLKGEQGLNNPFGFENQWLANNARDGHNVRFGAEYHCKSLSFRSGFAYYSLASIATTSSDIRIFSLGLGNTLDRWFWDVAYSLRLDGQESFWLYNPSLALISESTRSLSASSFSIGAGIRF